MMDSSLELALADLVQSLHEDADFDRMLGEIVEFARTSLNTTHAGITLVRTGRHPERFETVAATGPVVLDADRLQYELGEGPCLDAATEARSAWSADLASDRRWPTWGPRAADLGFRSILSSNLAARGQKIGALNLYGDRDRQFTPDDVEIAEILSSHAAAALAAARNESDLQRALDNRLLIGQAQGILMERFGLDAAKAFEVLRRYSQHQNVKLVAIAARLVDERTLPETPEER